MTETKIETREDAPTKVQAAQLFYLKAIFVLVMAVAVMALSVAWTSLDVSAGDASATHSSPAAGVVAPAALGWQYKGVCDDLAVVMDGMRRIAGKTGPAAPVCGPTGPPQCGFPARIGEDFADLGWPYRGLCTDLSNILTRTTAGPALGGGTSTGGNMAGIPAMTGHGGSGSGPASTR